jgi:hypothetical protein
MRNARGATAEKARTHQRHRRKRRDERQQAELNGELAERPALVLHDRVQPRVAPAKHRQPRSELKAHDGEADDRDGHASAERSRARAGQLVVRREETRYDEGDQGPPREQRKVEQRGHVEEERVARPPGVRSAEDRHPPRGDDREERGAACDRPGLLRSDAREDAAREVQRDDRDREQRAAPDEEVAQGGRAGTEPGRAGGGRGVGRGVPGDEEEQEERLEHLVVEASQNGHVHGAGMSASANRPERAAVRPEPSRREAVEERDGDSTAQRRHEGDRMAEDGDEPGPRAERPKQCREHPLERRRRDDAGPLRNPWK